MNLEAFRSTPPEIWAIITELLLADDRGDPDCLNHPANAEILTLQTLRVCFGWFPAPISPQVWLYRIPYDGYYMSDIEDCYIDGEYILARSIYPYRLRSINTGVLRLRLQIGQKDEVCSNHYVFRCDRCNGLSRKENENVRFDPFYYFLKRSTKSR